MENIIAKIIHRIKNIRSIGDVVWNMCCFYYLVIVSILMWHVIGLPQWLSANNLGGLLFVVIVGAFIALGKKVMDD